jgi:PleD family two-component response regulator
VHVLQRVRQQIAVRLETGHLPAFTASFGVASSDQAEDFADVVALADTALLQAKANGRDQIVLAGDRVVPALGPAPVP